MGAELISENSSDLDFALKVSSGDKQALKIFYNKYADLLFAYIKHLLNDVPLADIEDIWQETLLSAIKGLANFHGRSRLFTWICRIGRRKVSDYHRWRNNYQTMTSQYPVQNLENIIDMTSLPDDYLLQQSTRLCAVETLEILPVVYRQVLIQRYIDDLKVSDIAIY
jgi:RNA polymerase sigma-70 factor (ECF subfamily)